MLWCILISISFLAHTTKLLYNVWCVQNVKWHAYEIRHYTMYMFCINTLIKAITDQILNVVCCVQNDYIMFS